MKKTIIIDTNLIFSALLPFVALSIEIKAPLWTGDNKLKKGLIEKGFNDFYPRLA